jgi:hypothetical protein
MSRADWFFDDYIALREFHKLKSINLSNTNIDDASVSNLERLESLEEINLSNCSKITYQSLFFLSKIKNLKRLFIRGNNIEFYRWNYFKDNHSIKFLDMKNCHEEIYYGSDIKLCLEWFNVFSNLRVLKFGSKNSTISLCRISYLNDLSLSTTKLTQEFLNQTIALNLKRLKIKFGSREEAITINNSSTLDELTLIETTPFNKIQTIRINSEELKKFRLKCYTLNDSNINLVLNCSNIEYLSLINSKKFTSFSSLKMMKRLRFLEVGSINTENNLKNIENHLIEETQV